MEIEQKYPKEPNFGLVVALACGTLLVMFVLALLFVRFDGKHLTFRHSQKNPNAELVWPGLEVSHSCA